MAMRIMTAYFKIGRTVEDQILSKLDSWTEDTYGPMGRDEDEEEDNKYNESNKLTQV